MTPMKKKAFYILSIVSLLTAAAAPCKVMAEAGQVSVSPILITEIQPGTAEGASQEFIELYNRSDMPIDLQAHQWKLILASANAKNWDTAYRSIALKGVIQPKQSYIVASQYAAAGQAVKYLDGQAAVWFNAGISAGGGHLRLTYSTNRLAQDNLCSPAVTVADEAEWSGSTNGQPIVGSIDEKTVFLVSGQSLSPSYSIQRYIGPGGIYEDTNNDAKDFVSGVPTPGLATAIVAEETNEASAAQALSPADNCDPAAPAPGADGTTTTPESPLTPSEEDSGVIDDTPSANAGQPELLITELLPNPASPGSDATDEFVELYNPGDKSYDLSGYILEAGEATLHRYVLPTGTVVPPGTYAVFYSVTTGLSLSNAGSIVRLLSPDSTILARTDAYSSAPDGQAWVWAEGRWQWTTTATPGTANRLTTAASQIKNSSTTASKKAATTAKNTATKTAATPKTTKKSSKTDSSKKSKTVDLTNTAAAARRPLRLWVLAAVAAFAILYGTYEYRHDMANKFRQLRRNRAPRGESGQGIAGRRSNRANK